MIEGVDTEFKELDQVKGTLPDSVPKEIVAFANTEGGELYVGIRNDGSVVGVADPDTRCKIRCQTDEPKVMMS